MSIMEYTYYQQLGIKDGLEKTATQEDIKKFYRECVKIYHPDSNSAPNAEIAFKQVQEAYEVLSNPKRRKEYDEFLRTGGKSEAPKPEATRRKPKEDPFKDMNRNGSDRKPSYRTGGSSSRKWSSDKSIGVKLAIIPVKITIALISVALTLIVHTAHFALYNALTRIVFGLISLFFTFGVFAMIFTLITGEITGGPAIFAIIFFGFMAWFTSPYASDFFTEKILVPLGARSMMIKEFGKRL